MARHYLIALLLVVVTAAAFSQARRMEFVTWDDAVNVSENPRLNPPTLANVLHFWKQEYLGFYIPVTRTAWAGIAYLARTPRDAKGIALDPAYFHLANLAVHIVNVLLVFAILSMLIRSDWPAAAGAALFAIHPVQVEPVAWVTGMKDLLGGLLALIALWQYLIYALQSRDAPQARWRRLHYGIAIAAFALAVLSKQTVVVVPLMAWALDYWVLRRSAGECTRAAAGLIPVALGAAVVAKLTQGTVPEAPPVWARFFVAGDALAFYLGKLALPLRLGCHYARRWPLVLGSWWGYVTWLVPAALALGLWLKRRRAPGLVAAGAVFLAPLLPVLGLVPFVNQDVCDRFMYLAMLGPALALSWLAREYASKRLAAACVVGLTLLGLQSELQSLTWHNTQQLFSQALEVNPRSWIAHRGLGDEMADQGYLRQAYAHYLAALRIKPDYARAHESIASLMLKTGRPAEAERHYRQALHIEPTRAPTHLGLGSLLRQLGRTDEAIEHYRESLRLEPDSPKAHNNLATALQSQGRYQEAAEHYREAIRLMPDGAPSHYNLGVLLTTLGKTAEARKHLQEAHRLDPSFPTTPIPTGGQAPSPPDDSP
jgi:tetratricopeptide (TPR) repeat protein